jgi:aminoglycoside/choline kinase family phosphotransferase
MVDPQDDTARFAHVARHLRNVGLSAPEIFSQAPGLMLLEDFGDDQFAAVIAQTPAMETRLYQAAVDVLSVLENAPLPSGVNTATPRDLAQIIEPVFTDYLPAFGINAQHVQTDLIGRLADALDAYVPDKAVLVLRDFHAENMIWLPDRKAVKRIGLLDFQDALVGPPIYDLVSMLQDARRDVSADCHDATLTHYAAKSGRNMETILPAFHLLGIQRNLRILGIFARLAHRSGKTGYLDLIPRVWAHIQTSLRSPAAVPLAPIIEELFPDPTLHQLGKIKTLCQTP